MTIYSIFNDLQISDFRIFRISDLFVFYSRLECGDIIYDLHRSYESISANRKIEYFLSLLKSVWIESIGIQKFN